MLTTAIIAFREFLEAFLLVGIFLGMNKKFQLHKQQEIIIASFTGILFSLLLPIIVFFLASSAKYVLDENNADILEGCFLIFSGFFLAYVVFSLHEFMKSGKKETLARATEKMEQEIFDISLFFTLVFFIVREGFEVALLIATTSLFSVFWTNIEGLFLGFSMAFLIGLGTTVTYIKLPIKKVFLYTECAIILVGAAMVKNGVSLLLSSYFHIHWEKLFPLPLHFLPSGETIAGHTLNNLLGLQQDMSIIQVAIMALYIILAFSTFRVSATQLIDKMRR